MTRDSSSVLRRTALCGFAVAVVFGSAGCVRRTLTIRTHPADALVFLNDQEIGRSDVTTDFLWYGDYDVVIRKPGFQTLETHWDITPPWYQTMPIDFFAEVFWPGTLHDQRERLFTLSEQQIPTQADLVKRALETRDRALDTRQ